MLLNVHHASVSSENSTKYSIRQYVLHDGEEEAIWGRHQSWSGYQD